MKIKRDKYGRINMSATARANGIRRTTLVERMRRNGMSLEEAIMAPLANSGMTMDSGEYKTRWRPRVAEYRSWRSAKQRVTNPNNEAWHNYGGRGIRMCERWMNSYQAFLEDMGLRPGPGYSIERRDNDGDYCPENCYWATAKEQGRNKRNNVWVETPWGRHTLKEACRLAGVGVSTAQYRISRGVSPEEAIFNYNPNNQEAATKLGLLQPNRQL